MNRIGTWNPPMSPYGSTVQVTSGTARGRKKTASAAANAARVVDEDGRSTRVRYNPRAPPPRQIPMKRILALCVWVCVFPALAAAQTVSSIGASAVRSGDDFATRAFQDPWDMNDRTDLGWWIHGVDQPASGVANPVFAGGEFTAVMANGNPNVFLLD